MYQVNSYLKCHETKIEIKRSLHELLGWFFALSTRLAPPLFKIARLIVLWCYGGASIYAEINIIFISKSFQLPKFHCWKSNNRLDHWEDDVYLRDLFFSNWFLFSTFLWGNTMEIPNIFWVFPPNPTRALPWIPLGGSQCSPQTPSWL